MSKKRILILGAGISGLSLAYFLSKKSDEFEIVVLEKKSRPGGWIDTDTSTGYFFEKGPRTFLASKCPALLSLISELGLDREIVTSHPDAKGRWLWIDGKLKKVPRWNWDLLKGLSREWSIKPELEEDESVWDFACRRFNPHVAHHLFDPLCIGIHAGDIHRLSIRSCFPKFKEWEESYGSLTRGFFKTPRFKGPYLFALKKGVSSLVAELENKTKASFHYNEEVLSIEFLESGVLVKTKSGLFKADICVSALPCQVIGKLVEPELLQLQLMGTTVVNLGYSQRILNRKGFGYIVSSLENDEILGAVFNSNAFPQQSKREKETRITVKLRRTGMRDLEAIDIALEGLKRHLKIEIEPEVVSVIKAENAFPQMNVGYNNWIESIEKRLRERHPNLKLIGNYLRGVGVNDCIAKAKSVAEMLLRTKPS